MRSRVRSPFFIGWAKPPAGLRGFLLLTAGVSLAAFALAAYVTAATQNDPGDGAFRFDWGAQTLTGTLQTTPYPVLHVEAGEHGLAGTTVMLSGPGKRGVMDRTADMDGTTVAATGVMLTRGDLLMLQVRGNETGLVPNETPAPRVPFEDLGTWRLTGEICDGKCYAGAMRPGDGLAHRACANLCLIGGTPPVFVATGRVDGAEFFLMGDAQGKPLPTEFLTDWSSMRVTLTGTVGRQGSLPVFYIDTGSIGLAR